MALLPRGGAGRQLHGAFPVQAATSIDCGGILVGEQRGYRVPHRTAREQLLPWASIHKAAGTPDACAPFSARGSTRVMPH